MSPDTIICGTGRACEQTCPIMKAGRICPPVADMLKELAAVKHPWMGYRPALSPA